MLSSLGPALWSCCHRSLLAAGMKEISLEFGKTSEDCQIPLNGFFSHDK